MTVTALVLHDLGDAGGGDPWRQALEAAGWPGPVLAPDLPGHGRTPAPPGGIYELVDPALHVVERFGPGGPSADGDRPVVVGVGRSGWSATVLALGGRAAGLVLVDGLGGPWADAAEAIGAGARWVRAVADDPAALDPPPVPGPGVVDPVLAHHPPPMASRALAEEAIDRLDVPALFLWSARSPLAAADVEALAAKAGGERALSVTEPVPEAVAGPVAAWARSELASDPGGGGPAP